MASMTWDSDAMRTKSAQLKVHAQQYETIRKQLLQTATSIGNAYQSEDNLAYITRIEQFCVELQNMTDKLLTASNILLEQAAAYDMQEKNNTRRALSL